MEAQFADTARKEMESFTTAAKKEWEDTSRRLVKLQEELSEQHARAALDLAERHLDAMRAADLGTVDPADNASSTCRDDLRSRGLEPPTGQQRRLDDHLA